jgi:N-methylhydantoinase A/oxoprolinase/acetone carboxylase beta subunit
MGTLQVGPESAGAEPGPICYGRGGVEPTVTDADLLLGYLDADYFLGGAMKLDAATARRGVEERVAKPLGVSFMDAVWGIHDLINETMAAAAKTHIAERGGNPRLVTLAAFGGAGPVHACGLARKLGAPRLMVPPNAGVGSALGFFTAPRAFDLVRSHKVPFATADFAKLEALFRELEAEGERTLRKAGATGPVSFARSVEARFIGQGSETALAVPERDFAKLDAAALRRRFDETYEKLYGRTYPESPVEFVNFCVRASLPVKQLELPKLSHKGSVAQARKGERPAYCGVARDFIPHAVYDRYLLPPGAQIAGPAIFEERESTVVAGAGSRSRVDEFGFLWIELPKEPS